MSASVLRAVSQLRLGTLATQWSAVGCRPNGMKAGQRCGARSLSASARFFPSVCDVKRTWAAYVRVSEHPCALDTRVYSIRSFIRGAG